MIVRPLNARVGKLTETRFDNVERMHGDDWSATRVIGNANLTGVVTDAFPSAGSIAFTGFNADDPDSIAFAALEDIAAGSVIIFDDNEWSGTAFNTGEGTLTLTLTTAVAAGTIIRIDASNTATPTTSHGTIARSGSFDLSGTTESLYAYTGTAAAPTFLAALGISGFTGATTTGLLTNTGLTLGTNAIDIGAIDAGADIAAYDGTRSGQTSFAAYASIINNTANWVTQDAAGSQAGDGTNPDTPFSAVSFTIAGAAPGEFSIDNVSHVEGNAGTTTYTFTVTRANGSSGAVAVDYALVAPGGAGFADSADFTGTTSGTLNFADGQTSQTITLNVVGDLTVEDDEAFSVVLSNATAGSTITDATGDGLITNDDVPPVPGQLSIGDRTLAEGDSGTTSFTFTVLRTLGDDGAVSATWTLDAPGGANLADTVDFAPGQPTSGTVNFADGETSATITILVQGDDAVEDDETFLVTLSAPTGGATLGNANGTGTITNDDAAGVLSIGDRTLAEGNSGTTAFSFTVLRTLGDDGAVSATWTLDAPGGATLADSVDFAPGQPTSGTVSFADGETSATITILVQGDVTFEDSETFLVTLSAPTGGATLGNANGTGTITNDDPAPAGTLSIDDVSHSEGNSGTTTYTFTVSRAGGTAGAITADFTISAPGGAGNADSGDFAGGSIFSGQVSFADGETSRTISIDVVGDTVFEADEAFTVSLSNATGGATIGDGTGTGTIVNDDAAPNPGSISIADATIVEGNAGTSVLILTVTRSGGTAPFSVDFATANGGIAGHASASAGSDYVANSGTLNFADGQLTATISITINGDVTPELSEEFSVILSNATNGATLSDASAVATITTDDAPPASTLIFSENFTGFTGGGFAPNPTAGQIDSDIWRVVGLSDIADPAYGFTAITGDFARGTITTNDPTAAGVYSVSANAALIVQPTGAEMDVGGFIEARITNSSGSTATGFDIAFDWDYRNSADRASSLQFAYSTDGINFITVPAVAFTTPSTLVAGALFTTQHETLSLTGLSVAAGEFIYLRWIHANSAGSGSRDEVGIDNVTVSTTGGASGPLVSVSDVSVNEAAGTMTFTVTRSNVAAGAFSVDYATANGTATAGSDYDATSGTLNFADNQVSAQVTVTIGADGTPELDETLFLNLSNATGGATIADAQGIGTIVNDDGAPIQVSINDVSIAEGNAGTSILTFTVTRTGGTGAFDVDFATANNTATAGSDYVANSGTLSFAAGQNSQTISITINGDLTQEQTENFFVNLGNATNDAVIIDAQGVGTIVNDEGTLIHDIQGTSYFSPILAMEGISTFNTASAGVVTVRAIVTAVDNVGARQGYYLSEEITDWDGNSYTSEGIFVMTRNDANVGTVVSGVSVGDLVQVSANVMEYQAFSTMPRTVLVNPTGLSIISTGNALPTITLTNMPNAVMTVGSPDYLDSVDGVGDTFDASIYALSYFETVEGMLVTIPNMIVADGFVQTSGGDPYLQAYSLDSANPGQINDRGGYTISGDPPIGPPDTATPLDDTHNGGQVLHDGDVNPDIIELDFTDFATAAPGGLLQNATMGDQLGDVTGIIDFDFTDRKLFVTSMEPGGFVDIGNPLQETTLLGDDSRALTVATFNVENLDPTDGAARFTALANAIANNLNSPDIICIEEMQDNNGAAAGDGSSGTGTDASQTWQMLVDALNLATGAHYQWVDQAPVYNAEGGEQSGNIRVGFLYNTDRVQLGNLAADATIAERRQYTDRIGDGVRDAGDLIQYSDNMLGGEINTTDWTTTRKSLLGEFNFHGNTVYVTANHWPSKGGSGEFWQFDQSGGDPANSDWSQRNQVAQDVYSMLNLIQSGNPNAGIVAGGDFNDFYFYRPLTTMTGYTMADGSERVGGARFDNLTLTLTEAERYTYTFDGRSQAIDHIIANQLLSGVATYDVVHLNTGYNSNGVGPNANPALSDHDPGVSSYDYRNFSEALAGTAGADTYFGFGGNDVISTFGGNDRIDGGTGTDTMIGGDGDDTYFVDEAGDAVIEIVNQGRDVVYASASYTLAAGTSVEVLSARSHLDTTALVLVGNELVNEIYGNAGANRLDGGAGADYMAGLGGDDVYIVDQNGDEIGEAGGGGRDVVYARASYTLTAGAEVEVLSTIDHSATTAINLTGNALANEIYGNAGANVLDGGGGADFLIGLAGNDIYYVDSAGDTVVEGAAEGARDVVYTSADYVLGALANVEVLSASSSAGTTPLSLTGNALANEIFANAGNNVIDGGGGSDYLRGFEGNDVYYVDDPSDEVIELSGQGLDVVYARDDYVLTGGSEVEILSTVSQAATTAIDLTGNARVNDIYGNAGANVLDGKDGNDFLIGLGGADSYAFTTSIGFGNMDYIVGFDGDDTILLDHLVFSGLGVGALSPGAFNTGTHATETDDRIIYNTATGALYFDADGSGSGQAYQFAVLSGAPPLTASDFTVI
jgi:hypothetical protein